MFIQIQNTRKVDDLNKKYELITIKKLVKNILEQDAMSRNSDSYLYLKVICKIAEIKKFDLNVVSVTDFLSNMSKWGFPPFESVRRARQWVQEHYPELSSTERIKAKRKENEAVFRNFARGEL